LKHPLTAALCLALATGWMTEAAAGSRIELPEGPNRDLVYGKCRTCHDLQYVKDSAGLDQYSWGGLLDSMKDFGLKLTDQQRSEILGYLATYLGPNPPPAAPSADQPQMAGGEVDGATVFNEQCSSCHQPNGQGVPANFPPLAGNRDLFSDRLFPAYVLLNGLEGKITVDDHHFDGVMPPFDHLSDAEIAAVINYVRGAWTNAQLADETFAALEASDVANVRAKTMTASEVHAYREAHLD